MTTLKLTVCLVLLALLGGCATVAVPDLSGPPIMHLYTPAGYSTQWWGWFEGEDSCTIEYRILDPRKQEVARGRAPCQMFLYLFHAIQPRKTL